MTPSQPDDTLPARLTPIEGDGAGDHDQPYRFGLRPSVRVPFPFNTRQYARLLILRSRHRTTEETATHAA